MTAEEKADLQAEMKAAMAKTRERNLKHTKEHNLGGMIAARKKGNLNMNPLEKLDEFLKDYFACEGITSNVNLFSAYCYAQGEVDEKFVIGYVEDYARTKGWSMEVCQKLKRNVPVMIQEYYNKTNEKLGASMKN